MSDLKNCPFCGGDKVSVQHGTTSTRGQYLMVWCVSCQAAGGEHLVEAEAIAAWNRRALQAVGPEPVAWIDDAMVQAGVSGYVNLIEQATDEPSDEQRVRAILASALVATPPTGPVVEALLNERQKRAEQVHDRILAARDGIRVNLSPDSPEWLRDAFNKLHEAHHIMGGDPFDMHMRAALAAKPAVKDDETVVEALPNWNGWRSIDTAPEDCRVILATAGGWVGEAIMLRDEDTGEQVWTWVDTGKPSLHSCYGWMPLPAPLVAPVLSDLRPDGFDGPTGAE